jgi:putative DNA primase/helicase
MNTSASRHLTELAGLKAARLVIVPETEQGHSWAEARIKTVTGGEKIRANFMRQDHFEYMPQFKLLIAGNHRPQLNGHSEAMRRRLHLIPFDVTIPVDERDPGLTEKFKQECDGILRWMVDGCAEWQRIGLSPPTSLQAAVNDYLMDEDVVGQWVAECCVEDAAATAETKTLFASWKTWAEAAGIELGNIKTFGSAMRARGYHPKYVQRARGWQGIALSRGFSGREECS